MATSRIGENTLSVHFLITKWIHNRAHKIHWIYFTHPSDKEQRESDWKGKAVSKQKNLER